MGEKEIQMFQQCINYEGTGILRERERGGSGTLIDPKTESSPPKLDNSWSPSASFYLSVPPSLCLSVNSVLIVASWAKEGFFFHSLQDDVSFQ